VPTGTAANALALAHRDLALKNLGESSLDPFDDQYEDALKELPRRSRRRAIASLRSGQSHGCATSFCGNRTGWRRTTQANGT
jgi:hypothetical protein